MTRVTVDAEALAEVLELFPENLRPDELGGWRPEIARHIEALRAALPQPEHDWIPVSERLPEKDEVAWFLTTNNEVQAGYEISGALDHVWKPTLELSGPRFYFATDVTHWQPIQKPAPPEQEGE